MKSLSEKSIVENWEEFERILLEEKEKSRAPKRWDKLIAFYQAYSDRFAVIPASSKTTYHNAFPGGYIDHVLRVYKIAKDVKALWDKFSTGTDFTDEELAFVALNHDLGKFGDVEHEMYLPQDSKWHNERGEVYKLNPEVTYMKVADRSLFLLSKLGVKISDKEFLGIKLHDGLYEEANKSYFISYSDDFKLKTDLPYVIHSADQAAARIESMQKSFPSHTI